MNRAKRRSIEDEEMARCLLINQSSTAKSTENRIMEVKFETKK